MYEREAKGLLEELAKYYPVVSVTGPRQSGKTTLTKSVFDTKKYVTLEDLELRAYAENDPKGFLLQSPDGMIIDEAQNCPHLFSYIQGIVDKSKVPGSYILTGSQQFGLMDSITQSLAGRVGSLELLPFTCRELGSDLANLNDVLYQGFYPPIYDKGIPPKLWYEDYLRTYIERDVRKLLNIKDLSLFQKFLGLCAARSGQLLNFTELSNSTGVDLRTIKSWLSVLEASYIIFLLQPHHQNFSKKLVKTPKLYFYDVGLLSYLLRVGKEDMNLSPHKGSIFEAMIISEFRKNNMNYRKSLNFYFWRDSKGIEIDLIFEESQKLHAIEVKSGKTIGNDFFKNLNFYARYAGDKLGNTYLIYGGDEKQKRKEINIVPWNQIEEIFNDL